MGMKGRLESEVTSRFWTEKVGDENGQAGAKPWNESLRAFTQKKSRKSLSVGT